MANSIIKTKKINLILLSLLITTSLLSNTILQVNIDGHLAGIGSWLKGIIAYLDTYDRDEARYYKGIKFNLTGALYNDPTMGGNWWEYYFEQPKANDTTTIASTTMSLERFRYFCEYGATTYLSRHRAYEMIAKYIKIKNHVQQKINDFFINNFNNRYTIGIHYRGTDKISEAEFTPYEVMTREVQAIVSRLESTKPYNIFIATDDQNFLDYMKSHFKNIIYIDMYRSSSNAPIHQGALAIKATPYDRGEQALIDCILLSKCDILIRTHSNLSSVSTDFNPNIPVITVNRNLGGPLYREERDTNIYMD